MILFNVYLKIARWDKTDVKALLESITEDETEEMYDYLEYASNTYNDGFYYTYFENDSKKAIFYDYIRRCLFESIGHGTQKRTAELFSVV